MVYGDFAVAGCVYSFRLRLKSGAVIETVLVVPAEEQRNVDHFMQHCIHQLVVLYPGVAKDAAAYAYDPAVRKDPGATLSVRPLYEEGMELTVEVRLIEIRIHCGEIRQFRAAALRWRDTG